MTITQAFLTSEISSLWPDNATGAITPANARTTLNDIVTAIFQGISPLGLSSDNTWAGIQTFNATTNFNGGVVGTVTNPSSFTTSNVFNSFAVATDNLDASGVGNVINAMSVFYGFGGSSTKGARQGLLVNAQLTAATSASNTSRNYVGGVFECQAISNDGGGAGTEKGSIFGCNPIMILSASATHMSGGVGGEVDISCATGSSVLDKYGWSIVQLSTDKVQGSRNDAALFFGDQVGGVGWGTLIQVGDGLNASPLTTAGSILAIKGTPTIANGIDLSGAGTISGSAFKSISFSVSGAGVLTLGTQANTFPFQILVQKSDSSATALFAGITKGIRIGNSASSSQIEGVDNTGVGSFQPLVLNGSQLIFQSNGGTEVMKFDSSNPPLVKFSTAGAFTANGTKAVTVTSLGPNAIGTTTITKWLTFQDSGGVTSYVPVWQ